MSEQEYNHKMKQARLRNLDRQRKQEIRKTSMESFKLKKPNFSKLILFLMIVLCVQIVFFCEKHITLTGDSNSMYALIGIPVALVPIIWGYYSKSTKENTAGGIVYDMAMAQYQNPVENTGTVENTSEV